MNVQQQFGENLAKIRREKGYSQEKLALETGIARSYLSGVERGKRNISLINICIIAGKLEIPPSKLLDFSPILET